MELRFEAPVGTRILRQGIHGITIWNTDRSTLESKCAPTPWWDIEDRKWVMERDHSRSYSSHAPCRSFKAFRRHLRRHEDSLRGFDAVLCSRFQDHCVFATVK